MDFRNSVGIIRSVQYAGVDGHVQFEKVIHRNTQIVNVNISVVCGRYEVLIAFSFTSSCLKF